MEIAQNINNLIMKCQDVHVFDINIQNATPHSRIYFQQKKNTKFK